MRILDGKDVAHPKQVIEENEHDGRVLCSCGHEFPYDLHHGVNAGEWFGYIVPICPKCETIPQSSTRKMDM